MLITTSTTESKYTTVVISPVLFSKNSRFTEEFSINNSFGKSSVLRYLNWPVNLNNWSPLADMQSKSNLSHIPGDLNNVQLTESRDIHKH